MAIAKWDGRTGRLGTIKIPRTDPGSHPAKFKFASSCFSTQPLTGSSCQPEPERHWSGSSIEAPAPGRAGSQWQQTGLAGCRGSRPPCLTGAPGLDRRRSPPPGEGPARSPLRPASLTCVRLGVESARSLLGIDVRLPTLQTVTRLALVVGRVACASSTHSWGPSTRPVITTKWRTKCIVPERRVNSPELHT